MRTQANGPDRASTQVSTVNQTQARVFTSLLSASTAGTAPAEDHAYRDAVNAPLSRATVVALNQRLRAGDVPRRKVRKRV